MFMCYAFCEFCVRKILLITIIKTIITEQCYHVGCVLSSLCFGIALGEVFTVFGGLDCTVDVGTLTVLCIPHSFNYSYVLFVHLC